MTSRFVSAMVSSSSRWRLPPAAEDAPICAPSFGAVHCGGGPSGLSGAGHTVERSGQAPAEQPREPAGQDPPGELRAEAVKAGLMHPQPGARGSGGLEREGDRGVDISAAPGPDHVRRRVKLQHLAGDDPVEPWNGPGPQGEGMPDYQLEVVRHQPRGESLAGYQRCPDPLHRMRVSDGRVDVRLHAGAAVRSSPGAASRACQSRSSSRSQSRSSARPRRAQLIVAVPSLLPGLHQASLPEHPQMLRNRGLADIQVRHQLRYVSARGIGRRARRPTGPLAPGHRAQWAAMTAITLDGKATAAAIREDITRRVAKLTACGAAPGLGTVLVGDDPGSRVYVNAKHRDCAQVGFQSIRRELPATASQQQVEDVVAELNADPACTGYIVQLPLPAGLGPQPVLQLM